MAAIAATRFEMGRRLTALIPIAHERAVKGAELVAGGHVRPLGGSLYLVDGSAGNVYVVDVAAGGACNCPDSKAPYDAAGRKCCKHMCGVLLAIGADA